MQLNVIQVAESLGVEESVVLSWVRHERLPCVRDAGRLMFDRSQVAEWATERGLAARAGFLAPAPSSGPAGITNELEALLRRGGIWRGVPRAQVEATFARVLESLPGVSPEVRKMLSRRVLLPDGVTWAPVGNGLALPHLRSRVALGRDAGLIALLLLSEKMELPEAAPDGMPVDRLLFFVTPTPRAHLQILAALSASLSHGPFGDKVRQAAPDAELFAALATAGSAKEGA